MWTAGAVLIFEQYLSTKNTKVTKMMLAQDRIRAVCGLACFF